MAALCTSSSPELCLIISAIFENKKVVLKYLLTTDFYQVLSVLGCAEKMLCYTRDDRQQFKSFNHVLNILVTVHL